MREPLPVPLSPYPTGATSEDADLKNTKLTFHFLAGNMFLSLKDIQPSTYMSHGQHRSMSNEAQGVSLVKTIPFPW